MATMKSEAVATLAIGLVLFVISVCFLSYSLYSQGEREQQAKRSHEAAMENGHAALECELKALSIALDLLACTAQCPDWVPLERPSPAPSASAPGL